MSLVDLHMFLMETMGIWFIGGIALINVILWGSTLIPDREPKPSSPYTPEQEEEIKQRLRDSGHEV